MKFRYIPAIWPTETEPDSFAHCAQCGAPIPRADWSEHVNARCIRQVWSCEACSYQFETSIYLKTHHKDAA